MAILSGGNLRRDDRRHSQTSCVARSIPFSVLFPVVSSVVAEVDAVAVLTPVGSGFVLVVVAVLFGCAPVHEDDFSGGHASAGVGEFFFFRGFLFRLPAFTHGPPRSAERAGAGGLG